MADVDGAVPDYWRRILLLRRVLLKGDAHPVIADKLEDGIRFYTDQLVKFEAAGLDEGLQALMDGAFDA